MSENTSDLKNNWFMPALRTVFDFSFFLYGLYREMGAVIISGYLLIILIVKSRNGLRIRFNIASAAVGVMMLFYFISVFWAVDPWLALRGAVKFLPVLLFTICLMQGTHDDRMRILQDIPYIGAVMTVVSFIIGFSPYFATWIWWHGRLAGFFLYPNVFACFLLIGFEVLLTMNTDGCHLIRDIILGIILFFGLLKSASRTVFILTIPCVIIALLIRRHVHTAEAITGSLIGGYILDRFTKARTGLGTSSRIVRISSGSSSLRNRILYWKDAIPVALTHPFGFGYRGYSYIQGSVETGPYSVMVVHNSFLQIMLDIGWIPAALAFVAVVRGFFSKHATSAMRLILATLIIHSVLDFDLEFAAMYFILICLLDLDSGKEITFRLPLFAEIVPTVFIYALCLYVGIVCLYMHNWDYKTAFDICPWDTESESYVMERTADITEKKSLAEDILSRNKYVASAWNVLADAAYEDGDIEPYMYYKRRAISLNRYNNEWYSDYFYGMETFYEMYSEENDTEAMDICLSEIRSIGAMLQKLEAGTDSLAQTEDTGQYFTLPDEYYRFLDEHVI